MLEISRLRHESFEDLKMRTYWSTYRHVPCMEQKHEGTVDGTASLCLDI